MAEAIVILLLVIPFILAVAFIRVAGTWPHTLPRRTSAYGLSAILMLLVLGAMPSLMTFAAAFSIPAVFILGRSLFFRGRIRPAWLTYVMIAVVLCPVCYAFAMGSILLAID